MSLFVPHVPGPCPGKSGILTSGSREMDSGMMAGADDPPPPFFFGGGDLTHFLYIKFRGRHQCKKDLLKE